MVEPEPKSIDIDVSSDEEEFLLKPRSKMASTDSKDLAKVVEDVKMSRANFVGHKDISDSDIKKYYSFK